MNNYSNPMVTYDEIVDALKAIIDCSKANGYLEEYGFLNVKYDSLNQTPNQPEQEQALLKALQSLEQAIESANKVIREDLEKELAEINASNIFTISANYEHSGERRKLASQSELVLRLKEMSLPLEVLNKVEMKEEVIETIEELPGVFEEIVEEPSVEDIPIVETVDKDVTMVEPVQKEEVVSDEQINTVPTVEDVSTSVEQNIIPNYVEPTPIEEEKEYFAIPTDTLVENNMVSENEKEQPISMPEEPEKVQLIRKALEKARERGNEQLVRVLEVQLKKELNNLN